MHTECAKDFTQTLGKKKSVFIKATQTLSSVFTLVSRV